MDGIGRTMRMGLAFVLTMVLAVAGLVGASPSFALPQGIAVTVTNSGETYEGTEVATEGSTYTLRLQYSDLVEPGSTVQLELGSNVTLPDVPAGNDAVSSIVQDPNNPNLVSITFADPWPTGISQGVLSFDFTVNEVENSSIEEITWSVDGEQSSREVIIRDSEDEFADVTPASGKTQDAPELAGYVSLADGQVTVSEDVIGVGIPYMLQVDTTAPQDGFGISDQLPAELSYVADSFEVYQTTWDENGLNRQVSEGPSHRPSTGTPSPAHWTCPRPR